MRFLQIVALLIMIPAPIAHAQENATRFISVGHNNTELMFQCEGVAGSSVVVVIPEKSKATQPVLTQKLDESDDCTQASWTTDDIGSQQGSTLVMLNPGRLGINSQLSVFLVSGGSVSFAGYIPVRAERIDHSSEYRSYSSDSDSVWQRTDSLMNGRFVISREKQMMRTGFVCIGGTGAVLNNSTCRTKRIRASSAKPICIEYRNHVAKLTSMNACAELKAQWTTE
jgi:hypothetical protein